MASYETIRIEEREGFLEIVLNRPEVLNALNQKLAEELCDVLDWVSGKPSVRAVLVRGEGRAFSAGGDLGAMAQALDGDRAQFFDEPLGKIHEAVLSLARLPRPVVGAIHGFASGAGFNLALGCDMLLAAEGTRFNQAFVRIGAVPDSGGTFFLPRLVGRAKALELFFLGDFIDAAEALRLGIVNRVVAPDDLLAEARALCAKLATGPTRAYAQIKELVLGSAVTTLASSLDAEQRAQVAMASSADFEEGVRSFFDKRAPRFRGK